MSVRPRPAPRTDRLALPSFEPVGVPSAAASDRLQRVVSVGAHRLVDVNSNGLKIHDGQLVKRVAGLAVGVYAHDIARDLHRVPGQEDDGDMLLLDEEEIGTAYTMGITSRSGKDPTSALNRALKALAGKPSVLHGHLIGVMQLRFPLKASEKAGDLYKYFGSGTKSGANVFRKNKLDTEVTYSAGTGFTAVVHFFAQAEDGVRTNKIEKLKLALTLHSADFDLGSAGLEKMNTLTSVMSLEDALAAVTPLLSDVERNSFVPVKTQPMGFLKVDVQKNHTVKSQDMYDSVKFLLASLPTTNFEIHTNRAKFKVGYFYSVGRVAALF